MWAWHAPRAVRPRARKLRLAHRAARLLLRQLAVVLVGDAPSARPRGGYGVSAACLFVTSLIGGALGRLMSFSASPWYADYAAMGMTGIGLDPVDRPAARRARSCGSRAGWFTASPRWSCSTNGSSRRRAAMRSPSAKSRFASLAALLVVVGLAGVVVEYAHERVDVRDHAAAITGGDPSRGEAMFIQYGCGSCHALSDVRTATGNVGPPLDGIATRVIIAGHLATRPPTWSAGSAIRSRCARHGHARPQRRRSRRARHHRLPLHSRRNNQAERALECEPARCGNSRINATIRTASTADAIARLRLRPPLATGLSRKSPTVAPSGRVRMNAAQNRRRG